MKKQSSKKQNSTLKPIARPITRPTLKNRYSLAFLLGAISALAFAPTYLFILAIIGFSGLFLLFENEQSDKKAFFLGFAFGFGHFLVGVYWIAISLLVDFAKFGWLIPFALSLIPAALAVYVGLAVFITNKISRWKQLPKLAKIMVFAAIWVLFEYLRSILLSGFPWNLLGYSLLISENISQLAAITGIYGLSLLAILSFTLPTLLFDIEKGKLKFNKNKNGQNKNGFYAIIALLLVLAALFAFGSWRINSSKLEPIPGGNIRIVQPSTKQELKWDPELKYQSFFKNIELSGSRDNSGINYVIWSESAIPYLLNEDATELLEIIKQAVPKNGFLISGALRAEINQDGNVHKIFNSVFTINDKGKIVDYYDKQHLVPFGEYIPFQKYLPFINKITDGSEGFSSGPGPRAINPNNEYPIFMPLICYEVIFPGLARNEEPDRSDFLLNITNDAWFGRSSGPYQHLAMARVRAIENGLPLVRVANNGISALIDPYGHVVSKIGMNEIGILDIKLLAKLEDPTIYDRSGGKLTPLLIIFILSPLLILRKPHVLPTSKPNRHSSRKKA